MSSSSSLIETAGSCLMVGFTGSEPGQALLEQIARREVAGVILFKRNFGEPAEIAGLTRRLAEAASAAGGPPLLIGIDQEGGRVQRLGEPLTIWPPMQRLGVIDDVSLTERVGEAIAEDLAQLGFNLDFAPVLDVVSSIARADRVPTDRPAAAEPPVAASRAGHLTDDRPFVERPIENTVIGDRSFGSKPDLVARHGLAIARGLKLGGLLACGKHFPGHGGPISDSHTTLPVEQRSLEDLRACDLRPFAAAIAAGFPLLMSAHVVYSAIDRMRPGTLSPAVGTELLRRELGFGGVLISDDMEMAAVADHLEAGEAALGALRAGVDLLLFCHSEDRQQAAVEALVRAAERSSHDRERLEEARARVQALRLQLRPPRSPTAFDARARAELHAPLVEELRRRTTQVA